MDYEIEIIDGERYIVLTEHIVLVEYADMLYRKVYPEYISDFKDEENIRHGYNKFVEDKIDTIKKHDKDFNWFMFFELVKYYFPRKHRRYVKRAHTQEEWESKLKEYNYSCAYCGKTNIKLQKDHVNPIKRGGTDEISNIVPACRFCNISKGAKNVDDFIKERGLLCLKI